MLCQTINDHFWIRCCAMPHAMAGKNWGCCTEISGSQLGYLISLKCGPWPCFCSSMPQWLLKFKINDEPTLLMSNYKAKFLPISSNGCGPCFLIVFTALFLGPFCWAYPAWSDPFDPRNVRMVLGSDSSFTAILEDGEVVAWGNPNSRLTSYNHERMRTLCQTFDDA